MSRIPFQRRQYAIDWLDSGDGLVRGWLRPTLSYARAKCFDRAGDARGTGRSRRPSARLTRVVQGLRAQAHGPAAHARGDRELGPLNALLERDEMFSRIALRPDSDGNRLELQTVRLWRSPKSLLLPIGETLARCVCNEDFANIRACEGQRCTLIFADRTRRQGRRWSSMALCGNRAKQAAHRHRLKAER